MQTLRKKTSPLKYKNETTRFLGDGVSFKAKLIGILEVSEARGDRMCQEALADLKMAIRAAGEHKQRITINIAIDGLRLRDEKTGDSLYHHPVHKISFIAQDMTDSRAFGYIFGSPDTGHRFFGIKTDKAASQVVIAMRDLFQVVFALKKKEIELAKQHLDKNRFTSSSLFSDSAVANSKLISHENVKNIVGENKGSSSSDVKSCGTAVADLVDLELELSSLQQGLTQMERITPSDPFGSKEDPFGDSFTNYSKPILPPPPSSGRERSNRICETNGVYSPKLSKIAVIADPKIESSFLFSNNEKIERDSFVENVTKSNQEYTITTPRITTTGTTTTTITCTATITTTTTTDSSSITTSTTEDWFTQTKAKNAFDESFISSEPTRDEQQEVIKQEILSQFDVFTELDPLGTGKSKPYVDKKLFFQELKNPPKKVLNDLVPQIHQKETHSFKNSKLSTVFNEFNTDPFGEDPFVKADPFAETDFSRQDPFEKEFGNFNLRDQIEEGGFETDTNNETVCSSLSKRISRLPVEKKNLVIENTLPGVINGDVTHLRDLKPSLFELNKDNKFIGPHQNISLDVPLDLEYTPEPLDESKSTSTQLIPPPLPPKRQANDILIKPPPRPPHIEEALLSHANSQSKICKNTCAKKVDETPPIPVPLRKIKNDSEHALSSERSVKQLNVLSTEEGYLTPVSYSEQSTNLKAVTYDIPPNLLPPPQKAVKKQNDGQVAVLSHPESKSNVTTSTASDSLDGFEITLSQLTLSGLNTLAKKLNIPANQLNNMTLVQLTNYLSSFMKTNSKEQNLVETNSNNTVPTFHVDFAANLNNLNPNTTITNSEAYDRYAVFRELMTEEMKQFRSDAESQESDSVRENLSDGMNNSVDNDKINDKYAALREIVENELKLIKNQNDNDNTNEKNENIVTHAQIRSDVDDTNMMNSENNLVGDTRNNLTSPKYTLIEYNTSLENKEVKLSNDSLKSPKSPVTKAAKSPVPLAITEIVQNNTRVHSGSLSDVVSGSSPDIDNTGSNSEIGKKTEDDIPDKCEVMEEDVKNKRLDC